jgi:hypothetical protein
VLSGWRDQPAEIAPILASAHVVGYFVVMGSLLGSLVGMACRLGAES